MANEIRATYDTGAALYALIFNAAGEVWQLTTNTFVAYAAANIDNYDIALSEIATNSTQYRGTFDADIFAGIYSVSVYLQVGANPVVANDIRIGTTGEMHWDGSAEINAISDINTWYVTKSGNNSNSGQSWVESFLTVAAAVAAAASGDTILIGPGTYTEQIDLIAITKAIRLEGAGAIRTILSYNAGKTLKLYAGSTLRNMTVQSMFNPADGTTTGLFITNQSNILVEDCIIIGQIDAVFASGADDLTIRRCLLSATYDSLNVNGAERFEIDSCVIRTDGTYGSITGNAVLGNGSNTVGAVRNSQIYSKRTDAQDGGMVGVWCSGKIWIDRCLIDVSITNAGLTADVTGVESTNGTPVILLTSSKIITSNAGSGAENDVLRTQGQVSLANTLYDPAKIIGTIFDITRNSIVNDDTRFAGADIANILVDTGTTLPASFVTIADYVDTLETSAATIQNYVDTVETTLALIKTQTDKITTGQIVIVSPVSSEGDITIIQGDDYLAADNTNLEITVTNWTSPDLGSPVDATAKFRLIPKSGYDEGVQTAALEVDALITWAGSGNDAVFRIDLTAAQTTALSEPTPPHDKYSYIYQLQVTTNAGYKITAALGSVYVKQEIT